MSWYVHPSKQLRKDELPSELVVTNGNGSVQQVYVPHRTCHVVSSIRHDYGGGYAGTEYEHELSCGHTVWWSDDDVPDYCPWCGREVVYYPWCGREVVE